MTERLVVVVNHWGGVPGALHENVISQLGDRMSAVEQVALRRLDPALGFRDAICNDSRDEACLWDTAPPNPHTIFHAFRAAGYRTVVLGACGLIPRDREATRSSARTMPDPRESMRAWGIDRCSSCDGAHFRGNASVHDEEVVHEARRILLEHDEATPLLLWLNLRSCIDTTRVRFARCDRRPLEDGYTGVTRTNFDRRLVPRNVNATSIQELTDLLRHEDAVRHGEVPSEDSSHRRDTSSEYACVLDIAIDITERVDRCVTPFLVDALRRDGAVAVTATHSLCLGEHGIRSGAAPTRVCASTFWCSSISPRQDAANECLPTLNAMLRAFARSCGVRHGTDDAKASTPGAPVACLGRVPAKEGVGVVARVVCRLHDHNYACIVRWDRLPVREGVAHLPLAKELYAVFDLDADPDEVHNVLLQVRHLHEALRGCMDRTLPHRARVGPLSHTTRPERPSETAVEARVTFGKAVMERIGSRSRATSPPAQASPPRSPPPVGTRKRQPPPPPPPPPVMVPGSPVKREGASPRPDVVIRGLPHRPDGARPNARRMESRLNSMHR